MAHGIEEIKRNKHITSKDHITILVYTNEGQWRADSAEPFPTDEEIKEEFSRGKPQGHYKDGGRYF